MQKPRKKIAALRVERRELAAGLPHPRNPRIHPIEGSPKWKAMQASLADDYFDPLILNERNGMWVSGHFRAKVLLSDGYTHADMVIVDYDEKRHCARMLAANNHFGDYLADQVDSLLAELDTDLERALAGLGEEKKSRSKPPELVLHDRFHVIIDCTDEAQQLALLARLTSEGLACRALVS